MKFYHLRFGRYFVFSVLSHSGFFLLLALLASFVHQPLPKPVIVEFFSSNLEPLARPVAEQPQTSSPEKPRPEEKSKEAPPEKNGANPPGKAVPKPTTLPSEIPANKKAQAKTPPTPPILSLTAKSAGELAAPKNNQKPSEPTSSNKLLAIGRFKPMVGPSSPNNRTYGPKNVFTPNLGERPSVALPKNPQAGKEAVALDKALYEYQQNLITLVESHWLPWGGKTPPKPPIITVEIGPGGDLRQITLTQKSGSPAYDQLALNAVKLAAPFPPQPAEFPPQKIFVVPFKFAPKKVSF